MELRAEAFGRSGEPCHQAFDKMRDLRRSRLESLDLLSEAGVGALQGQSILM